MKEYRFAVAVMAGGHSTRMGQSKHSVIIKGDGRTFLNKICDEADEAKKHLDRENISGDMVGKKIFQRYLSVREDQDIKREGYISVNDIYKDIGPIGGIASVLKSAEEDDCDAVLFLACDMIKYDKNEIINIIESYRGEDILYAETKERGLQPLASIYSVSILENVISAIGQGNYRLRDIRKGLSNVAIYKPEDDTKYNNFNSPDEL
ncbi:MAG: molybdenum cofactor guanylyltransferase [Eubacterium sp.]|nr:molybdenum cofactor guanylyltransferase [Eubacterium sp.]